MGIEGAASSDASALQDAAGAAGSILGIISAVFLMTRLPLITGK